MREPAKTGRYEPEKTSGFSTKTAAFLKKMLDKYPDLWYYTIRKRQEDKMMKYYNDTDFRRPSTAGAKFLKVERNKLNPLPGLTFVSIGYWKLTSGEIIGIVF
jgi:hypothetical protein